MPVIVAALSWSWRETEVDPLTGAVSANRRDRGPSGSELAALEHALRLARAVGCPGGRGQRRPRPGPMRCCGTRWRPARRRRCASSRLAGRRARARPAWSAASRNRPPRSPPPCAGTIGVPDLVLCGDRAGRPGHWLVSRVPGGVAGRGAGPGMRAAGAGGRACAAGAPPPRRRPPRGADGAAARRGVGRGGRGAPAAGRAARHPGQRKRRDHGGRRGGGRRGAADQGPRRPPVPAPAARASRVRPAPRCAGRWS